MSKRIQEAAAIISNDNYRGDYFQIVLSCPKASPLVQAGQFSHLQLPETDGILLRRPFSIYDTDPEKGTISIIYKRVGKGTDVMSKMTPGQIIDVLAPLGNGFPSPPPDAKVLIVAGGYGCAATYLLAKNHSNPGICMIGARNEKDVLVEDKFEAAGYEVKVSTNDGSRGHKGLVTELLEMELERADTPTVVYACGPNAMLKAVGDVCMPRQVTAWLSLDQHMCCGLGGCFACVVKIRTDNADGWEYVRSCKDGPVFDASTVHWD